MSRRFLAGDPLRGAAAASVLVDQEAFCFMLPGPLVAHPRDFVHVYGPATKPIVGLSGGVLVVRAIGTTWLAFTVSLGISLPVSVALAALTDRYVELPFLRRRDRWPGARAGAVASGTAIESSRA